MFYIKKMIRPVLILLVCSAGLIFSYNCFADDVSKQGPSDGKFVSIDFNNVDINVFIKFMSKLTGKNFIVDSRVKGNVTIISPTKISIRDAYKVFESVLEINGYSTVESGKIIKIIPTPKAKGDNIDTKIVTDPGRSGAGMDRIVTRIIPLEYARSTQLKTLLTPPGCKRKCCSLVSRHQYANCYGNPFKHQPAVKNCGSH